MKCIDHLFFSEIKKKYTASKKRCFFLDYDGTLVPIEKEPSLAIPDSNLISLLQNLSNESCNHIYIISGRDAKFLDSWFGNLNINLIAEHGALVKDAKNVWLSNLNVEDGWKDNIRSLLNVYVNSFSGSIIEEKTYSLAWHYRNLDESTGIEVSQELIQKLEPIILNTQLEVLKGKKVIEIKMKFINKGVAVSNIVKQIKPDFILCIGDDTTDEDMFKALQNDAITIKVGTGFTNAKYVLPSQNAVFSFLKEISYN